MKRKNILLATVTGGLVIVTLLRLQIGDGIWPAFSRDEASARIGMRVQSAWVSAQEFSSKCPASGGLCTNLDPGERGTVVGILQVKPRQGFFLIVRWDKSGTDGTPLYSWMGRYTFRTHVKPFS